MIAGVLLAAAVAALAARPVEKNEKKSLPFEPGETLTYDVNWSIFHAGQIKATLEKQTHGSDDTLVVKTSARSQGFVSLLYKVEDDFKSVLNPDTLCSVQISKQINEGRRHRKTNIIFDHVRKLAILEEQNLNSPHEPPKHTENEIPGCVEDIISAFYYVRSQPLNVGQKIDLAVNDGSKTRRVVVTVLGREKIQTPLGTQQALKAEPDVFESLYAKKRGRMLIWFSDDDNHYPLRVRAMLRQGTITGTLTSVSSSSPLSTSATSDGEKH